MNLIRFNIKMMRLIILVTICQILNISAFSQIRVACIGNSITYGFGVDNPQSYPSQLNTMLGNGWEIGNFGVRGATLLQKGDLPYYKQKAMAEAMAFKPDVVIIELGTNDSKAQNWKYKENFITDYTAIINDLKALPSKPFIILSIPLPTYQLNFGIRGGYQV